MQFELAHKVDWNRMEEELEREADQAELLGLKAELWQKATEDQAGGACVRACAWCSESRGRGTVFGDSGVPLAAATAQIHLGPRPKH
jgi:hypothetical protein